MSTDQNAVPAPASGPPPAAAPTATATAAGTTDAAPRRHGYGALWASVPREFGFLILTLPIGVIALTVLATTFFTGLGLLTVVVGVFICVAALFAARGFGMFEVMRLRWAGRPEIRQPVWDRGAGEQGFWRTVLGPVIDGHYWLYLLHGMVLNPIVSIVSWTITVVWTSMALGGLTGWIWRGFVPDDRSGWPFERVLDRVFPGNSFDIDPTVGQTVVEIAVGMIFLLTLPLVFRGLTLLHDVIARGLLGAWRSEALQVEVAQLAVSRGAAVQAEDASLRRLERDIHDGPQQRLVRLQMDLAAIERKLDTDPETARTLLGEARDQARESLEELRALSRGFAPPILQDRGLAVALQSLASRSPVPVILEVELPTDAALPAPIERNVYFVAAELLANAAKHAEASAIRLRVSTRDAGESGHWLDLWVIDNGRGGATVAPGHGLAGLEERVTGLRGMFVIDSPAGGPTTIGAHVPYVPLAASGMP